VGGCDLQTSPELPHEAVGTEVNRTLVRGDQTTKTTLTQIIDSVHRVLGMIFHVVMPISVDVVVVVVEVVAVVVVVVVVVVVDVVVAVVTVVRNVVMWVVYRNVGMALSDTVMWMYLHQHQRTMQ
jgi:hypothetical protein